MDIESNSVLNIASNSVHAVVIRGEANELGWCELQQAPGEDYFVSPPSGTPIGCLWHLSDLHVCDAESPSRLEYLDRYSDPDSPFREEFGDIGTYRPQEILTVQVALAMIETVNATTVAPVTGGPINAVLITGDLTDNAQENELDWYQTLLEGGTIAPRSGHPDASSWVGTTDPTTWDERYWHPDGAPAGVPPDRPTGNYGYPAVPGLVAAARREVESPGLVLPWISVYGNHDGLLQGTVAPSPDLRELSVGSWRVTGLPKGRTPADFDITIALSKTGPANYPHTESSPVTEIVADAAREFVSATAFTRKTRPDAGGSESSKNYYSTEVGDLLLITLDTVNPHGGWQGSIDSDQCAWLIRQLDRYQDRYVVIASHHPSPCLTNGYAPRNEPARVLQTELEGILLSRRNVIAWLAGHVHHHASRWHQEGENGFWEITTSSLIDWPQQARILEFVRINDRRMPEIAIISTVMNHASPATANYADLTGHKPLAAISRTLAANDYRLRAVSLRGLSLDSSPEVRNTVWRLRDPLAG